MASGCEHDWQSAGVVSIGQGQGLTVLIILYCKKCTEPLTRLAGPPEETTMQTLKRNAALAAQQGIPPRNLRQ